MTIHRLGRYFKKKNKKNKKNKNKNKKKNFI